MSGLDAIRQAGLYGRTVARVAQRGFRERGGDPALATERLVFVVGWLLGRGWLRERARRDDVGQPYGPYVRSWVEPERREEFARASETTRAAWAWRRYVTFARAAPGHTLEVRYEEVATDPMAAA